MSSKQEGTSPAPVVASAEEGPSGGLAADGSGPAPAKDDAGGGATPRKPWRRVIGVPSPLLIAGSAVVAIALTLAAFALTEDGAERKRAKAKPQATAPWAAAARQRLAGVSGIRYEGTVRSNDRPVHVKLTVLDGGAASGSLTAGAEHADVVAAGGDTYLKAAASFWKTYGGETEHAADYAGRWTKAPANLPGLDVKTVFAPDSIAKRLLSASSKPPTENVGNVRAYRVKTPRADYLVGADAPNALLKVQAAGGDEPVFSVADATDATKTFAEVRGRVATLGGAADPALRFRPGKLSFLNCDQNVDSCTVSVPATLVRPASPPDGARAALLVTILADGRSLGTCTGSGAVPANGSLVLRCSVTSAGWRSWMRTALDDPGAHPYEARARVLGEAVSASRVSQLLAQVDRHRPNGRP